ncbi:uncharacterized protein LOC129565150 [Sitodiplosis mosellana]|uniref:uncharacterized protein LOC129565150 n=1 Tax=Sitodiplosis mosellana TaxID=263140 RepID=UPI0024448AAF|nr:uncharacterized protein LOC129565150 [Sitodiplosis mosellana]
MLIFRHVNNQIFTFLWCIVFLCNFHQILGHTSADSWLVFAREAKKVLSKCYKNHTVLADSWSCLKHNSLLLFDDIAKNDRIPLTDYVELLRRPDVKTWHNGNYTQLPAQRYYDVDLDNSTWSEELKERVFGLFDTHGVRLVLQESEHGEARGRHRRRMMPAMVFGMAALGLVIIPLGFHIMANIAGLALLLGKMALLIATITSLKRLAAPGTHFGLYTEHQHAYYPPQYWERNDRNDRNGRY